MGYKKVVSRALRTVRHASETVSDVAEDAGKGVGHALAHAYTTVEDHIADAGKHIGHMATHTYDSFETSIDDAIATVCDRIQREADTMVEHTRHQISTEVQSLIPGASLLVGGMVIVMLSVLLLSLAGVSLLIEIVHLPAWASYALVSGLLAIPGLYLVYDGRKRLRRLQSHCPTQEPAHDS